MLDALRRGATTWVAKILLALLVGSFAVWGISDVVRNFGVDRTVATVGGTDIEAARFQQIYTRQLQAMSRQLGMPISGEMAASFGLPQQVLAQMMSEAALTDAADDLGLGVSDEALARQIAEDPALRPQGATAFDRAYFNQLLRDNGMTEEMYIADRRLVSKRNQLTEAVAGGVTPPTALLEALNRFTNDIRTVDYILLDRSLVEPVPAPTDEQLASWYESNRANFQAPEYRTIHLLSVTPEALADPAAVEEDAVRAEYDRSRASYGTVERRRVEQVLFPTVEDATAAAAAIKSGSTLEAVAAERGLEPTDLGLIDKSRIIDPAIAEAAFSLPAGGVSEPIAARFGGALVRVTEIEPESVRPFEEVRDEIRQALARRQAETTILDTYDEVEDARAGGASLDEIANRFKLPLRTVEVDATGATPAGEATADLPSQEQLLADAFESDVGVENDPLQVGRGGYVWYEVQSVTPARDRELSEVRDRVVAAWTEATVQDLLVARTEAIAEAVRGGKPLAEAAAEAGVEVRTAENVTRNAEIEAFGPTAVQAAFDGPEGHVSTTQAPDGDRMVLKVTNSLVTPFFPEAATTISAAERFGDELENTLLTLYVADLQNTLGSSINQRTLQNAIGTTGR